MCEVCVDWFVCGVLCVGGMCSVSAWCVDVVWFVRWLCVVCVVCVCVVCVCWFECVVWCVGVVCMVCLVVVCGVCGLFGGCVWYVNVVCG